MWSLICLAVFAFTLILVLIWVLLGKLLSADFASDVLGSANLQWTDVDCDVCIWSCHRCCAVCWKDFLVWRWLVGMTVSGAGLVVPSLAAVSASSFPGIPMWLEIQLIVKFLLLLVMSVWISLFCAMLSRSGLRIFQWHLGYLCEWQCLFLVGLWHRGLLREWLLVTRLDGGTTIGGSEGLGGVRRDESKPTSAVFIY